MTSPSPRESTAPVPGCAGGAAGGELSAVVGWVAGDDGRLLRPDPRPQTNAVSETLVKYSCI